MLLVPTIVKPSKIEGLGLHFATDVPAGTIVWRYHSACDRVFTDEDVTKLSSPYAEFFMRYAYKDLGTGLWLLCGDDARFVNHSYEPSVLSIPGETFTLDITARDVHAGEEYTANYADWDAEFDDTLYH